MRKMDLTYAYVEPFACHNRECDKKPCISCSRYGHKGFKPMDWLPMPMRLPVKTDPKPVKQLQLF